MKLQKIILCAATALTAFGASVGLLEIGIYLRAAVSPVRFEIKPPPPIELPVVHPQPSIPDFKLPVASEPTDAVEPEAEDVDFGQNGYYYIVGDEPEGFEDFEHLDLTTHDWSEKKSQYVAVKPYATLLIKNKQFKLSWLNLTGKRISFISRERNGVSYQFDGRFIEPEEVKIKSEYGDYTDDAVLKGRLTKWRDGKKIDEAKVKFGVHHGC